MDDDEEKERQYTEHIKHADEVISAACYDTQSGFIDMAHEYRSIIYLLRAGLRKRREIK